jgi:hypothetical protein
MACATARSAAELPPLIVGGVSLHNDPPLTPSQRDYLAAFDAWLRAPRSPVATERRERALLTMLDESQVDREAPRTLRFRRAA